MSNLAVLALRIVVGLGLAGTVFIQTVIVPLLYADLDQDFGKDVHDVRIPVVVIVLLGFVAVQVTLVCIWKLSTMMRRGTVFTDASFRYVDVVIGAAVAASLLTFTLGVVLAPGETVAPGIVLLIGGAALMFAGVALLVLVLRMLLAQAVARDAEASELQAELDEVI